jgi:tRNA(Ile)-lysidine synthase
LLNRQQIEALFAPLGAARGLLLAVSGGPDSTALLSLVARWRDECAAPPVFAATVDHGLRPEGAAEAEAAGALSRRLRVPHATLFWSGDKPVTRLQERARKARYRLLVDHARSVGADTIVTAHHLDDQAETVLMRLSRGSGIAGLAGMAALSDREGFAIARPLLSTPKAELVAYCQAEGLDFADDPSNRNPRFARARMRLLVAETGLDVRALTRLAARAARAEQALAAATDEAHARLGPLGVATAAALLSEPLEIRLRLIGRAVASAGGDAGRRLRLEKLEALTQAFTAAATEGRRFSANVGGARLTLRLDGQVEVKREPPRRPRAAARQTEAPQDEKADETAEG